MAYVLFQYDRPSDTQHWNDYNRHVWDWIARLRIPGAVSFLAYRTADAASPDTITVLEFHTLEVRNAIASEPMTMVLDGLRSVGAVARVVLVERSPFTPEPIRG
jgi:hypothetical protein